MKKPVPKIYQIFNWSV